MGVRAAAGYELLTRFGATLEGRIDSGELGPRLAAMVRDRLNVEWVRVRIRRELGERVAFEPIGVAGIEADALATSALTAPLVHGEEWIGEIDCGPKRDGAFSTRDQEFLTAIGRQAALAIRSAALTAELAERPQDCAAGLCSKFCSTRSCEIGIAEPHHASARNRPRAIRDDLPGTARLALMDDEVVNSGYSRPSLLYSRSRGNGATPVLS